MDNTTQSNNTVWIIKSACGSYCAKLEQADCPTFRQVARVQERFARKHGGWVNVVVVAQ